MTLAARGVAAGLGTAVLALSGAIAAWRADLIVARGWEDPQGTIFFDILTTLLQLLATFISIMIVYVVFKLTFVFQHIDEEEQALNEAGADVRSVRGSQKRLRRLLSKKESYVRPLHGPIIAMTAILVAGIAILPFSGQLASNAVLELRVILGFITCTVLAFLWTLWQAFGSAIER